MCHAQAHYHWKESYACSGVINNFEVFDIDALKWSDLTSKVKGLPKARCGHGLLSFGGKLYVWGGWDGLGGWIVAIFRSPEL